MTDQAVVQKTMKLTDIPVMPPNSPELEEIILSYLLSSQSREIAAVIFGRLTPEDFYIVRNRLVFECALSVHRRGRIVDFVSVRQALVNQNLYDEIGGPVGLTELSVACFWTPDVEGVCGELVALTTRRQMLSAASNIAQMAYDTAGAIEVQHAKAVAAVRDIRTNSKPMVSLAEAASSLIDEVAYYKEHPLKDGEVRGLSTGIVPVDQLLGGIKSDDFLVCAASPGTGKTALWLQACDTVASAGKRVLIFSFEMKLHRLLRRIASRRALLDWRKVEKGILSEEEEEVLNLELVNLTELDTLIVVDERLGLSGMEAAIIKHWPLDLVMVDNLHIVNEPRRKEDTNNVVYYGRISRGLFDLSKSSEHSVPVVTIAHMNRGSERENRKPNKTDLRESGEIEQNADIVMFMWVPDKDVYPNEIELFLAKNRDGDTGTPARIYFDKPHQRFCRLADVRR